MAIQCKSLGTGYSWREGLQCPRNSHLRLGNCINSYWLISRVFFSRKPPFLIFKFRCIAWTVQDSWRGAKVETEVKYVACKKVCCLPWSRSYKNLQFRKEKYLLQHNHKILKWKKSHKNMTMICSKHINTKIKVTKGDTQIVHMCCLWATVETVTSVFLRK